MARKLIASLSSPSGRYSAKVFSYGPGYCLESHIFILGERQHYATMETATWAEAMHETTRSLRLEDANDAKRLQLATKH